MKPILPYGRQEITEADIQAVVDVMRGSHLTQGPKIAEFEAVLAKACGAKYAVAVNSGTAALHIACLAARIGEGDEVITSPITFVASSNCAFYTGATPVFADVTEDTGLIDPKEIEKKITARTSAIIPVHLTGQPADMDAITRIAKDAERKHGKKVYVIEDAAHALGATFDGKPVGSGQHSDMTILSFHPVKHVTTGEGGAVLTNDPALYRRLQLFRSHGITRDLDLLEDLSHQPWGYEQHELGFNYRLTDLQCALGISQMKRLEAFVSRRQTIAAKYREFFADVPGVKMLRELPGRANSYHLFVLLLDFQVLGGRAKVVNELRDRGLITQIHYIPVHLQPYYKKRLGTKRGDFPRAEAYYERCLSIPMFPAMTDADVERVCHEIKDLVAKSKKSG